MVDHLQRKHWQFEGRPKVGRQLESTKRTSIRLFLSLRVSKSNALYQTYSLISRLPHLNRNLHQTDLRHSCFHYYYYYYYYRPIIHSGS